MKIVEPSKEQHDRALRTAIVYTAYLKKKHPQWSFDKLKKRTEAHLNIKFV